MEMEIDDMHEPHLFNFAAFGIFTSKAEGSLSLARRRSDIQPVTICMTFMQLLSLRFTGARTTPTGLPGRDHEHARPAGAEAPYFLSLEADAFC